MGWKGLKNGELIARAATDGFEILLSTDRGLASQQNRAALPIAIIVMLAASNDLADLIPLVPQVLIAMNAIQKGQVVAVS